MAVTAKTLRDSMMDNLEARGLVEDIYLDKVEEYLSLWKLRRELEKDIRKRGVAVMDERKGGICENRSVSLCAQVSRQMLAIFSAMGFKDIATGKGGAAISPDDDEL